MCLKGIETWVLSKNLYIILINTMAYTCKNHSLVVLLKPVVFISHIFRNYNIYILYLF